MSKMPVIQIRRLRPEKDADLPVPAYMTSLASGMDVYAALDADLLLTSGQIDLVPTGLAMAIPAGFEVQIRPRSGLAIKHGITIVNSPGTIDANYRGEIKVGLINLSRHPYTIRRGDRIAQMVVQRVFQAEIAPVDVLDTTERNDGGFGHTGQ